MVTTVNHNKIMLEVLNSNELMEILSIKNSEFFDIMSSVELPQESLKFYKATYQFGDNIINNQNLFFTLEDKSSIAITSDLFPQEIANDIIGNNTLNDPLGLIINKGAEIYLDNDLMHTDSLLYPGNFIGIPRALDPENKSRSSIMSYNLSAGCRSVFMLEKISNRQIYKNIFRTSGFDIEAPDDFLDHWKTFASITNNLKNEWKFEIIYFSRSFIDLLHQSKYSHLYIYLNKIYSKSYSVKHSTFNLWQVLYFMTTEKHSLSTKYNPLYANAIKHIFMVAANAAIAFQPATSNMMLPLETVQTFFKNHYGLDNPVIMEPTYFDYHKDEPVYLSLNFHSSFHSVVDKSVKRTKIAILEDIKYLFDKYLSNCMDEKFLKVSSLNELVKNVDFSYFHNSIDIKLSKHISMAQSILDEDSRFITNLSTSNTHEKLAQSLFFSGGIMIRKKLNLS